MPKTLIDEAGNEIVAFMEDEVKALEEEKGKAVAEAQSKLDTLNQELAKLKEKDLNFSNLRSQKEDAERKVDTLKQEFEKQIEKVKKEVHDANLQEYLNDRLASLANGDEEAKKKIEFHYNRLSDPTTNKEEVDKKLRDAWSLSQERQADKTSNAFASLGAAPIKPTSSGKKWDDDEKALAKSLAAAGGLVLTDEDFK